MKKIFLTAILFILAWTLVGQTFPQRGDSEVRWVEDITTPIGRTLANGDLLFVRDSASFYMMDTLVVATATMQTIIDSGWYVDITTHYSVDSALMAKAKIDSLGTDGLYINDGNALTRYDANGVGWNQSFHVDDTTFSTVMVVTGTLASGDITISDATPTLSMVDTDGADNDVNFSITTALTDVTSGNEDADITFTSQIAGTPTNFMVFDADGDFTITSPGATSRTYSKPKI